MGCAGETKINNMLICIACSYSDKERKNVLYFSYFAIQFQAAVDSRAGRSCSLASGADNFLSGEVREAQGKIYFNEST